jgi:hypothetical protein
MGWLQHSKSDRASCPIEPELYLRDGQIIRPVADAVVYMRAHEVRPGVDNRDEVLHRLERACTAMERQSAIEAFLAWLDGLDVLLTPRKAAGESEIAER